MLAIILIVKFDFSVRRKYVNVSALLLVLVLNYSFSVHDVNMFDCSGHNHATVSGSSKVESSLNFGNTVNGHDHYKQNGLSPLGSSS